MADEKTRAMIAISNEFKDLNKNPLANIGTTVGLVNKDNLFEWTATMLGPTDTSYSSGLFILRIKFPNNYLFLMMIINCINRNLFIISEIPIISINLFTDIRISIFFSKVFNFFLI